MTTQTIIALNARETAAFIRKDLKKSFAETKFSIASEISGQYDSVTVTYKNGKEPEGIREYLANFQSTHYDMLNDYHELRGFEYEGQEYTGADYIYYSKY